MLSAILSAALAASGTTAAQDSAVASPSVPPAITMELVDLPIARQAALRCAAAIAIATEMQRAGNAAGKDWPDLLADSRGREFFVRSVAGLMDETGLTREAIALRGRKEALELQQPGRLDEVMPACLLMLDASGL